MFGGVNTLRNWIPTEEVLRRGYVETESTVDGKIPVHSELPLLLDKVLPVHHVVQVDAFLPGCPPHAGLIHFVLSELVEGRHPDLAGKLKYG